MSRMYETIYIVKPELVDEESKALSTKVQEIITSLKGDIKRLEDWGVRKLAYPIQKLARGRYMYLRFDGEATMVAELERRLRIDDRVIRYQTVKLEKDVTPAAPAVQAPAPAEPAAEAVAAPAENE
ncbi:30S ribosomal protein S6 [Geobacter argillaceus]|uniref:Small ribosomal subunit protein bS6 n=1 Tax=Geobacter argillaceus TaxID=345631 RepID=A0A562VEY4_9BACT|nr:30S ribosomal protein S6 [Geobacter argillaceus]TWJ16415.1 SSU ribosomal protein S6P [Geobacter argillaceus]